MQRALSLPSWQLACGALLACTGLLMLGRELGHGVSALPPHARLALAGGTWAAGATALGTLPVLLAKSFSPRSHDAALGMSGGVMLAATVFSLVLPAIAASKAGGASAASASLTAGAGIMAGVALIMLLGQLAQLKQLKRLKAVPEDAAATSYRLALARTWLFVAAVTLHNLPEGWAIGVAYAGVDQLKAHALAGGIALQDVPEGLVVALALRAAGYGRVQSSLYGAISGLIEPAGALAGALLIDASASLLPWGLASAAGAMLYVTCHELIPEAHRRGHCRTVSCSFTAGFIVMMMLDTAFS